MCYAQKRPSFKFEGKPMPDWVIGKTPEPDHFSYYYKVFEGVNVDVEAARNQAIVQAFQQALAFVSTTVNSADVYEAIAKGTSLKVVSETFSIPIYFTCEFYKKLPDDKWHYWMLCQIAIRGNIDPHFNTHFTECNTHNIWEHKKDSIARAEIAAQKREDGLALVESLFIPGLGQMMKGSAHHKQSWMIEGGATLASEVVLFSIGAGTYLGAKKQESISNQWGIDYDTYTNAIKQKKVLLGTSYAFFGLAVVAHGVNLYRAYTLRENKNIAFYPVIIPTTEQNLAYGVGATIKF